MTVYLCIMDMRAPTSVVSRNGGYMMSDTKIFELGDLKLQCGATLKDAKLAYDTYGTLNPAKDNVVIMPHGYSLQSLDMEWMIGADMALDPAKYFIVVPNMFGNGLSSSPSNTPAPHDGPRFPNVTICDNVRAQHRLVTEAFGIERIKLVTGWSMGGLQTFQWGALYPDMVERIAPTCGSAKCARHNYVFLEGVKAAITADAAWNNGDYDAPPKVGLRAMARVYAGWGFSQTFYRNEEDLALGFSSLEDFLASFWDPFFADRDANNLLTMLWTWQHADASDNELYGGDIKKALNSIKAKAFVMPCRHDLYFPPEDSEIEVANMPNAELRVFESTFGHVAAYSLNPFDVQFHNDTLTELLAI
jgi:homoserine O-acetyltransferase/O-succinyltransferase